MPCDPNRVPLGEDDGAVGRLDTGIPLGTVKKMGASAAICRSCRKPSPSPGADQHDPDLCRSQGAAPTSLASVPTKAWTTIKSRRECVT